MTLTARSVALEALARIDEGAYANIVLPSILRRGGLDTRDRRLATELVYGTTRMRRACDHLIDRFARGELEPEVRRVLRLGAYQLAFTGVPDHAAVSATVDLAPQRASGLVNAVLRKVARQPLDEWPDLATRLSYPDWLVNLLQRDLGPAEAAAALEQMNRRPVVTEREDGYIQDQASQWVAEYVSAAGPSRVADICAAPGGKATAMGSAPAHPLVVAADLDPGRAGLISQNTLRLQLAKVVTVVADGAAPPFRPGCFDAVLVDAPCSGLGVLGRRPDARWRLDAEGPVRLAGLQRRLVAAASDLVAEGGRLYYSVCTVTAAETLELDGWAAEALAGWEALAGPAPSPVGGGGRAARPEIDAADTVPLMVDNVAPDRAGDATEEGVAWRPHGRGWLLLPQDAGTDGMYVLGLRRPASART
ncbi:MAG TPA: transcription antitermination factor NusB [Acidimicrobiales bacterium]|nr:transcription antitermination factor NusB [Acidimicrobiales bacterium]